VHQQSVDASSVEARTTQQRLASEDEQEGEGDDRPPDREPTDIRFRSRMTFGSSLWRSSTAPSKAIVTAGPTNSTRTRSA